VNSGSKSSGPLGDGPRKWMTNSPSCDIAIDRAFRRLCLSGRLAVLLSPGEKLARSLFGTRRWTNGLARVRRGLAGHGQCSGIRVRRTSLFDALRARAQRSFNRARLEAPRPIC
jgi:hypothetical protein